MFSDKRLREIFDRTNGHCHFCGDPLKFNKYGMKSLDDLKGVWEIDHVVQKGKGGSREPENCLPACYKCNRLRWHRKGKELREILLLGLIAKDQIKKPNLFGKELRKLRKKRLEINRKRRRGELEK